MNKGSVPSKESVSAIDNNREKELNEKLVKAINTDENTGQFTWGKMIKTFRSYIPAHG